MQKEEIIQLHTLFAKIKDDLEKQQTESKGAFSEYEKFGVFPEQIDKSKNEHKRAIFILTEKIAETMAHE